MMNLLATTTFALLISTPQAELPEIPGEPDRVDISCTVSTDQAELNGAEGEITAVHCEGLPGFFVPRARYRRLAMADFQLKLLTDELEPLRKANLQMQVAGGILYATVQKQEKELERQKKNWLDAEKRFLDLNTLYIKDVNAASERAWHESPVLWLAVGIATTIGVGIAAKSINSALDGALGQ